MKLWSSSGWLREVESEEQAKQIAIEKIAEDEEQKITLSKIVNDEQINKVMHNGVDENSSGAWLDIIRMARELDYDG